MTHLFILQEWTLHEGDDYRYLRGRPIGHPNKPSDRTIMTTQVSTFDGMVAVTGETTWALGERAA